MRYYNLKITQLVDKEWNPQGKPTIHFYDAMYAGSKDFEGIGQFVSSYFVETLLDDRETLCEVGLDLHGGVPAWKVSPSQMVLIFEFIDEWLKEHITKRRKS